MNIDQPSRQRSGAFTSEADQASQLFAGFATLRRVGGRESRILSCTAASVMRRAMCDRWFKGFFSSTPRKRSV